MAIGLGATLATFAVIGLMAVDQAEDDALATRLKMARAVAAQFDYLLTREMQSLQDAAYVRQIDPTDGDSEPERAALREAYLRTVFNGGLYVLDTEGRPHLTEPANLASAQDFRELPHVQSTLSTGRVAVSDAYRDSLGRLLVSVTVPLRDRGGRLTGLLGGDINLMDWQFQRALGSLVLGPGDNLELVDSRGTVIASTRSEALFTTNDHSGRLVQLIARGEDAAGTCHACHAGASGAGGEQVEKQVMAFAPLTMAPWGVLLLEPEQTALAASHTLRTRLLAGGGVLVFVSFLTVWVTAQSIRRPLRQLTAAADIMAAGDLRQPVRLGGRDEIGRLAQAFEVMRRRLKHALDRMGRLNVELEQRVRRRTRELQTSHVRLQEAAAVTQRLYRELQRKEALRSDLLRRVISAQEEERRRVARELHDETSQALTSLLVALKVMEEGADPAAVRSQAHEAREIASQTLTAVHDLARELRPSALDHLGLAPALERFAREYATRHRLELDFQAIGLDEVRLPPRVETTLYRVAQEALTNVARHARARRVAVLLERRRDRVVVIVEDDGQGFDPARVEGEGGAEQSLGIFGMRERAALVGGTLAIESQAGAGSTVFVEVPLTEEVAV